VKDKGEPRDSPAPFAGNKIARLARIRISVYPLPSTRSISPSVWCLLRILLLSDIHANLEALEAAWRGSRLRPCSQLGDVVGYGASPRVIDRSRALGKIFVRGNHDKAATGLLELDDFNPMAAAAASGP